MGESLASSCSFKTQIRYQDGSIGCIEDLAFAKEVPFGNSDSLLSLVEHTNSYYLIKSKTPKCKGLYFAKTRDLTSAGASSGILIQSYNEKARSELLDQCSKLGCECEVVIADGVAQVSKVALLENQAVITQANKSNLAVTETKLTQQSGEISKEREGVLKAQKLADEKNLQQDLAKQKQLEIEQKQLAEKARIEQDLAKQKQLEIEQKQLAEKARIEQDRVTAEISRIQAELAKVKILEKDKSTSASAQTTKSVSALVIGNSNYNRSPLANPTNDANEIAKRLTQYGFTVKLILDGDRKIIIKALNDFQNQSSRYDVNILFYAGHGIQYNGVNYLIPTDMSLDAGGASIEFDGISVNQIIDRYMQAKTRLVFLDACRDNPLSRSLQVSSRSGGNVRGLAAIDVNSGTLISYSTKDGNVALDGNGRNSPYTESLLKFMDNREDIALILRKVRQSVMDRTSGKQVPWDYGSLVGDQLILSNK